MTRTSVAFIRTDCKEFNEKTKDLGDVLTNDQVSGLLNDSLMIGLELGLTEPLITLCDKGSKDFEEFKDKSNYIQKTVQYD